MAVEWVAESAWNQWPNRRGMGGRIAVEWVAESPWNGWPNRRGIRSWSARIEEQLKDLPPEGKRATRLRTRLEELQKYLHDREENWKNAHLRATDEPATRLVLDIEGAR